MPSETNNFIKRLILAHGMSFNDLAKATGYAPQTVRNVASGSSNSEKARYKIEKVFGLPLWSRPEAAQPARQRVRTARAKRGRASTHPCNQSIQP
jgi:transcriptional regulator with XRE-family HTH domain